MNLDILSLEELMDIALELARIPSQYMTELDKELEVQLTRQLTHYGLCIGDVTMLKAKGE